MKCPRCQHENPPQARFCMACGVAFDARCARCGTDLPGDAQFCFSCGQPVQASGTASRFDSPSAYTPKHLAEKILTSRGAMEGERKGVTVMFSDVSGFTAISEKLDPEEVHAIMDQAFEVILNEVHRYEGTINQFLGDGVMALFGAPVAHEDDVYRAIAAALAIQRGLSPLADEVRRNHGIQFRMRVGINTGPVVVGAIGKDLRMDYTAVGDTTNLAARLLSIAKPGQIVVSPRTQQLGQGFFVFEDIGEFQLKGKAEPIRAYAVTSEISGRTRLEVSKERGLTPLVGRDEELMRLAGIHRRAAGGQGAIAIVVGDPGVGKSRLLYEFLRRVDREDALELEASCASYGRSMAYRPIVELLRRYLEFPEALGADEIRRRVTARHRVLGLDSDERSTLVARFLGVSAPPEFLSRLSAPQLKELTVAAVCDVFLRASATMPVILMVENMHWIDSASEELLGHLAGRLSGHRLLLLFTTRQSYTAPWLVPSLAETITLRALGAGDIRGMVRTLLAAEVSEELFRMLAEKSEGNPLYVEEFLRQLQETEGIVVGDGEARLSRPDLTVPATIHDIIASRIDRLAEAHKRALQVASVVGRRFGVSLVSRILGVGPDEVTTHLRELHALDFVFPSAQDPELMYSFKHALTQDVVYAGVLERRRRMYHAAAALGLEDLYAGRIEDVVELVAYHFGRGHVWDKAVTYLRQAAAKAQARSGHREALAALEEALKMLRHLPETRERREQEIDVRLECRATLYPLGEFDKMLDYLREAGAIASAIPDPRRLGLVSIHIAEYYRQTGRFAEARRLAEQALEQGDKLQNLPLQLYASHYLGLACHALGDYRRACDVLRTVTTAPRFEWRTAAFVGMVVGSWEFFQSITLAWLARCLSERGEFGEAIAAGQRAVALAEETGGPYSVAAACLGLGYGYLVRGDLTAATPVLERSLNVAREGNVTLLRPQAARLLGCAFLRAGRIEEGAALARTAADEVEYRHLVMQQPAALAVLAEACLCFGDLEEAETAATLALTLAIERGQRGDAATAHYLLGKAAARESGDIATAEEHFRAGIALAEELDMRPLVAHSHLGLGKLYGRTDKRGQAHEHLTTATAMYREMGMTYWLEKSEAEVKELRG